MNADQELHQAIQARIAQENNFFNLLKTAIKDAVDKFDLCDTSTSPEVEESVNLSIDGLQKAIDTLKDEATMNTEAADSIKEWFSDLSNRNNLVQDSKLATSSTPTRSFADRAKGWLGFSSPSIPSAMPPPPNVQPKAIPSQSFLNRLQSSQNPQTAPAWNNFMKNHNSENFNEFRRNQFGGKRKTRKYRRRV